MAMGSFDPRRHQGPMAEINVVPLVDVMLVLLVIFIITAPLLTHSVKIDLPKASSAPNITQPEHIEFGIRENGALYWNGAQLARQELDARFAVEAKNSRSPNSTSAPTAVRSMKQWPRSCRPLPTRGWCVSDS